MIGTVVRLWMERGGPGFFDMDPLGRNGVYDLEAFDVLFSWKVQWRE